MTTEELLDRIETIAVFEDRLARISNTLLSLQHRMTVLEAQVSPGGTRPPDPTRARGRVDDPSENQLRDPKELATLPVIFMGQHVIALVRAARAALDETEGTAAHVPLVEALRFFEDVPLVSLVRAARAIGPSGCDADAFVGLIEALKPFEDVP